MNDLALSLISAILIGLGATLITDLWALFLKRAFKIPSPNFCLVGRRLRYMTDVTFKHADTVSAPQKTAECTGFTKFDLYGPWVREWRPVHLTTLSEWTVKTHPSAGEAFVFNGYDADNKPLTQEVTVKKFFKFIGILVALGILTTAVMFALLPWMDRWGAAEDEITASYPGDRLVPSPRLLYTRAISINAPPGDVYPWIVQLGADKGGMYSYTWIESLLQCSQTNADRIHEEWQELKVGDKVLMCQNNMPPGFEVALIEPNNAIVMGHQENGVWSDVWQFILVPQDDGTTRLVLRSRDAKEGWFWDIIRPGEFIMVRGMMLGIKERAEGKAVQSVMD